MSSPKAIGLYVAALFIPFPTHRVSCLAEYMTLPVSQYSVLDAEKVERLDENTFKVQTSTVSLFRIKMTPVMILTVTPHDSGCEVQLLKCTVGMFLYSLHTKV